MIPIMIAFLIMLNPFALFLYLQPIMKELSHNDFVKVLAKASLISFLIYLVFMFTGDFIIKKIFQIDFESFRIFGGIVIFSFAYYFIVKGQLALVHMKENLDDLAAEIALPFMVGAGTISLAILMGNSLSPTIGPIALTLIMAINYILILILKAIRDEINKKRFRIAFDKHMEILLRINGFFIGAIGIDMIITGLKNIGFV